jgi:hypothetical protein
MTALVWHQHPVAVREPAKLVVEIQLAARKASNNTGPLPSS